MWNHRWKWGLAVVVMASLGALIGLAQQPRQPLWQRPEGIRLTELARTARITKQSMGALVDSLEHGGYVERVDDPDDARAWRVRLTARGHQYGRDVRKFAQETEKIAANRIGARRLEELRKTLSLFVDPSRERSPVAPLPAKPD